MREPPGPSELVLFHPPPTYPARRSGAHLLCPPSTPHKCFSSSLPFHIQRTSLETDYFLPLRLPPPGDVPVSARQIRRTFWALRSFVRCLWRLLFSLNSTLHPKDSTGDGLSSPPYLTHPLVCPKPKRAWWAEPGRLSHFGIETHLRQTCHNFL